MQFDFEFNELNTGPSTTSFREVIHKIMREQFEEDLDHLLCILEIVSISTQVESIGNAFYYGKLSEQTIDKEVHPDYENLIEEVKQSKDSGPSQYYNWYLNRVFPLVYIKHEVDEKDDYYRTFSNFSVLQMHKPIADEYVYDFSGFWSEDEFKSFLSKYVTAFRSKKWFTSLPYAYITLRPITFYRNKNKCVPLGNVYILLGRKTPLNESKIQLLLLRIYKAWMDEYGSRILSDHIKKGAGYQHIPFLSNNARLTQTFTRKEYGLNLIELFEEIFGQEHLANSVKKHLITSKHPIIIDLLSKWHQDSFIIPSSPLINSYKKIIDEFFESHLFDDFRIGAKESIFPERGIINQKCAENLGMLLSKRRLYLLAHYVFNFDMIFSLSLCKTRETRSSQDSSQDNALAYLSKRMYIYKSCKLSHMAIEEKTFLQECINILIDRMTRKITTEDQNIIVYHRNKIEDEIKRMNGLMKQIKKNPEAN
ncbi:MAG: hypothetical protein GC181_10710 [Bacteroidetes bacterium]|nr:hypothetical protein [Bacteroidota bacterium]